MALLCFVAMVVAAVIAPAAAPSVTFKLDILPRAVTRVAPELGYSGASDRG
jgi:hypothetical protein